MVEEVKDALRRDAAPDKERKTQGAKHGDY